MGTSDRRAAHRNPDMCLNHSSNVALVQGSPLACIPVLKLALPVPRGCKRSAGSAAPKIVSTELAIFAELFVNILQIMGTMILGGAGASMIYKRDSCSKTLILAKDDFKLYAAMVSV